MATIKPAAAEPADGGAAAPATTTIAAPLTAPLPGTLVQSLGAAQLPGDVVHTSAQPDLTQPTAPRPRDAHTGVGGTYVRDQATGERRKVEPDVPADAIVNLIPGA